MKNDHKGGFYRCLPCAVSQDPDVTQVQQPWDEGSADFVVIVVHSRDARNMEIQYPQILFPSPFQYGSIAHNLKSNPHLSSLAACKPAAS